MSNSASGRKLFGAPVLLQDWDKEAEEGAAQYWELFLDLLLVAAASSIADEFKEHLTLSGFLDYAVMYLIIVNGWMLYTHHITTRFEDASLAHSLVLFVYLLGFGACIVNASLDDARPFSLGALLMRASVLIMLISIAACIPRARYFCVILTSITCLAMVGLCLPVLFPQSKGIVEFGLWFAAAVEFTAEIAMSHFLEGPRLIPINIDQSKERLGALVLVMLGETVLSVTITYRELKHGGGNHLYYYWVLGLSFLLIFMFTLLFFHMQPPPNEHAFRRSRTHGTVALLAHKILGLALLTVGVSVKLVVEAVMDPTEESASPLASRLMGLGVGAAFVTLFFIRYMHYGNKSEFHVGTKLVCVGKDPKLDCLVNTWWWTFGVACVLPFLSLYFTTGHALLATALYAGLVFLLCILETTYTHLIMKRLDAADENTEEGEQEAMIDATKVIPAYQGTIS